MERQKGFIILDKILQEIGVDTRITRLIKESPQINIIHDNLFSLVFSFEYHGETYYYKFTDVKGISPYNELIAEELAHDFGIPCASYDLAVLGDIREGTISKDYRRDGAIYISGYSLLSSIYSDAYYNTNKFNSLEGIWDVLEYRYQDHPNKRTIICHLMERLIQIYLYDILVSQLDRHSQNWEIMETEDGIDIAPIYDNECLYPDNPCYMNGMNVDVNDVDDDVLMKETDLLYKSLESFKKVSNEDYVNIIKNKLWIIGEENLNKVFERIEKKTGYPMPEERKQYYLDGYKRHREKLEEILNKEDIKRK